MRLPQASGNWHSSVAPTSSAVRIHVLSDLHLKFGPYKAASMDAHCIVLISSPSHLR